MRTARRQLAGWLLLLIFSMQAMAPGISARWMLCLGCEETGFALEVRAPALVEFVETCCTGEGLGEEPDLRVPDCECLRLAIESAGPGLWMGSRAARFNADLTLMAMVWSRETLVPGGGGFGPRNPGACEAPPNVRSLLWQRTCLLI
ncbi:MAG: hypothetical protein KJZ65_07330 [Phycisphaerales bacterium]|nr:hypothetical protein [Phycisphaerales bacterium]